MSFAYSLTNSSNFSSRDKFIKLVLALIATFFISFLPGPFIFISLIFFILTRSEMSKLLFVISTVIFFIEINFDREIFSGANDLIWYTLYWKVYSLYPVTVDQILNGDIYTVMPKASEPVFHVVNYILSNLSSGNYVVFVAMNMLSTYLIPSIIISKSLAKERANREIVFLIVFVQMYVLYDFGNAYNIIRQQMCMSVLLLAFYQSYKGNIGNTFILCILGVLTHNSASIVIIPILLFSLKNSGKYRISNSLIYSMTIGAALLFSIVFLLFAGYYEDLPDSGRGIALKVIDYSVFVISCFIVYNDRSYIKIWNYYASIMAILLATHVSTFLPLRYFTYLDSFKWIGWYIAIDYIFFKHKKMIPLYKALYILPFIYFYLKFTYSTYEFHDTLINYFMTSPYEYFITNDMYL